MINKEQISAKLAKYTLTDLSFSTRFQIRQDGLISGLDFLMGFFSMVSGGYNTLLAWAQEVGAFSGNLISPQALQHKLQFRHIDFVKNLLGQILANQLNTQQKRSKMGVFDGFKRVFLEDSSCFALPSKLYDFFKGSTNKYGSSATARVQLRLELRSGQYTNLELQSFRDNDQKFAADICQVLEQGDLVIRDMGYAVLDAFEKIDKKEAFFLSRLRFGINVYDAQTGAEIDLLKLLRKLRHNGQGQLDIEVLIGKEKKLRVRLMAAKVPPQVEQQRKRKANKDRSATANHSKKYMEFLGWTLMVTNVQSEIWTIKQALHAYSCRWYIEIVFKCWKSELNLAKYFSDKKSMIPSRAIITFYLLLIWVTLFYSNWYHFFMINIAQLYNKWVSPLKFAQFARRNFSELLCADDLCHFIPQVLRYACYDKRKTTTNMMKNLYLII